MGWLDEIASAGKELVSDGVEAYVAIEKAKAAQPGIRVIEQQATFNAPSHEENTLAKPVSPASNKENAKSFNLFNGENKNAVLIGAAGVLVVVLLVLRKK